MRGPLEKWETFHGINKSESGVAEVLVKVDPTVAIGKIGE